MKKYVFIVGFTFFIRTVVGKVETDKFWERKNVVAKNKRKAGKKIEEHFDDSDINCEIVFKKLVEVDRIEEVNTSNDLN